MSQHGAMESPLISVEDATRIANANGYETRVNGDRLEFLYYPQGSEKFRVTGSTVITENQVARYALTRILGL